MRSSIKIALLLLLPLGVLAKANKADSLNRVLKLAKTDVERYHILRRLGFYYLESNPVKSLGYWEQSIAIAKKDDKTLDEAYHLTFKGYILMELGRYPESFQCLQLSLAEAEDENNETKTWNIEHNPTLYKNKLGVLAQIHHKIGLLMAETNNTEQAIVEYKKSKVLAEQGDAKQLLGLANLTLAQAYMSIHQYDLALRSYKDSEAIFLRIGFLQYLGSIYAGLGDLYLKQHMNTLALQYFYKAVSASLKGNNLNGVRRGYEYLSNYYIGIKQPDSSLSYAIKTLNVSRTLAAQDIGNIYTILYKSYQLKNKIDSAYKYQALAIVEKDSSYQTTIKSLADFQKLSFGAQLHAQELEKEKAEIHTKIRIYTLLLGIVVLMLLAAIFYRNNRQKQKANIVLNRQKEEVQSTLSQLIATQSQLIQSEKMASLGELTAGIAHEIQNPLNFVNNFSEVSIELLEEMEAELKLGQTEDAIDIAGDVKQNLEKIIHHGKRADGIVKGMLQHSRASSGVKEPVNINVLADEYFRLAYHGLRAKDKTFNSELVTNYADHLPLISIIPQDIGRVMLNLFTNAFYAVHQKQLGSGPDYKPTVELSTATKDGRIQITVKDNGMGMPEHIKDKIMQPFFTTKPTGEGTGLGLSMSYDIVVKGHGGTIQVNSTEGEGSEFIITIPIS